MNRRQAKKALFNMTGLEKAVRYSRKHREWLTQSFSGYGKEGGMQ